jgi:hypothetical protein
MTLSRRLAKIETSLSPTQLVLRWLAEAHAFGDIESYVASLLAEDPPVAPLDRLAREAAHGARTSMRGKRPELVEAAVRSALRETVFRFELVMRINITAHELLDREALIDAALSAHVALLACEDNKTRLADATYLERFASRRDLLAFRVSELRATQEARSILEGRYLEDHGALFPGVAKAWDEQVKSTGEIADMAVRLAEFDGVPPAAPTESEAASRRTTELVADLVEPTKAEALEKLGEGQRALGIANDWVRTKLLPCPTADLDGTGQRERQDTRPIGAAKPIRPIIEGAR